ncbi:MAG: type II secretion system F family protein [Peptococcaceae bacterium]|nr:type II secretion system F family protein [Peptococcaceae bacterium]
MITILGFPALLTGAAVLAWCMRRVRLPKALEIIEWVGRYGTSKDELRALGKRLEARRVPVPAAMYLAGKRVLVIMCVLMGISLLAGGKSSGVPVLLSSLMVGKVPDLLLDLKEKKRKEEIKGAVPLMTEQIRVFGKAVGYYDALKVVAMSWKGVLGHELALLSAEMELVGVVEAMDNFAARCNVDEIRDIARIITVNQHTGADIDEILSNYSRMYRQRKASKIKRWIKIQPVLMSLLPGTLLVIFVMMFIVPMVGSIINQLNSLK